MSILAIFSTIWGFISDTLGIIGFFKNLGGDKKNYLSKFTRKNLNLKQRLQRKYPKTTFFIADNKEKFNELIARELIKVIDRRNNSPQTSSSLIKDNVKVGIVCGPMALYTAQWISKNKPLKEHQYSGITFVAMNKAGEMDSYYYAANYLVPYFSSLFPGSGSVAYTNNKYDQTLIKYNRKDIDILLCSVGSLNSREKTYIEIWLDQLPKDVVGEAAFNSSFIGDFCLTPMDADGKIAVNPAMEQLIRSELDPYPVLKFIGEIKQSNEKPFVIFPVNITPKVNADEGSSKSGGFQITGKEIVTRAVLRSGIANVCILESTLAKNLERAVGGFLIHHLSVKPENNFPLRKAKAYDLFRKLEREIAIFDPNDRLDMMGYEIDKTLQPPLKTTDIIPSIIFGETTYEDAEFDWKLGAGFFDFRIDGSTFRFTVEIDVRKPGMWAIMSALQGVRYIRKFWQNPTVPLSIWDLGCGSGIIGILMDRLTNGRVNKILFSDIAQTAIDCAEINVTSMHMLSKSRLIKADLFDAAEPNEKFHFIIFNPPFMPMAGITNLADHIDSGGDSGQDIATRFCNNVYDHLEKNGWAIIVVPDYIDDGRLQNILNERFGETNVVTHNRFILYPFEPKKPIPTSFEIQNQATIEKTCNYKFENCYVGDEKYLSFRMRHYLANRVE